MRDWKKGQTVCVVYSRHRSDPLVDDAKITKIGRKWATVNGGAWNEARFDMGTGYIDGGEYSSPGCVYTDRAEYEERARRDDAWQILRRDLNNLSWFTPSHMTVDRMDQVRAILFPDTTPAAGGR